MKYLLTSAIGPLITLVVFGVAVATKQPLAGPTVAWLVILAVATPLLVLMARRPLTVGRAQPSKPSWSPLHHAVNNGNQQEALDLIKSGVDVDGEDSDGTTPLHLAVQRGDIAMSDLLISHGANVRAVDGSDSSVLVMALLRGHPELVRPLLAAGADPDQRNKAGSSGRSLAAEMGETGRFS